MRTLFGKAVAISTLLLFPTSAYAGTKSGEFIGLAIFAFVMGIAAATWPVTNKWRRTEIFFANAGICVSASCVWLMLSMADRPLEDLLVASIVVTMYIAPVPFIVAFAVFRALGLSMKSDDHRDHDA